MPVSYERYFSNGSLKSLALFLCLYFHFWAYFTPLSRIFIIDFEWLDDEDDVDILKYIEAFKRDIVI